MTKTAKIVVSLVVVVVIIGLIVWATMSSGAPTGSYAASPQNTSVTTDNNGAMSSPSDSSDAALNQDMTSVNGQMNGLNNDSSNVDAGMNASQNSY